MLDFALNAFLYGQTLSYVYLRFLSLACGARNMGSSSVLLLEVNRSRCNAAGGRWGRPQRPLPVLPSLGLDAGELQGGGEKAVL